MILGLDNFLDLEFLFMPAFLTNAVMYGGADEIPAFAVPEFETGLRSLIIQFP